MPEAILVALLLLPGFLTERIAAYFSSFPPQSDAELIASALAFTLVDLVAAWLLTGLLLSAVFIVRLLASWVKGTAAPSFRAPHRYGVIFIVIALAFGAALGRWWAWAEESDFFFHHFGSSRATRADVWYWVFHENAQRTAERARVWTEAKATCIDAPAPDLTKTFALPKLVQYVRVVSTSGEVYEGSPSRFSGDRAAGSLFIEPASVEILRKDKRGWHASCSTPVGAPSVPAAVLLNSKDIQLIEWLDWRRKVVTVPQGTYLWPAGETVDCAFLKQQKVVQLAEYEEPACAARVPTSVIVGKEEKEDSKDEPEPKKKGKGRGK